MIYTYVIGFLLSLALTIGSYFLVSNHLFGTRMIIAVIIIFGLIQLCVQLLFFLHLGSEKNPRWKLLMFISTFGLVFVVMVGSIWIMQHLNYNMTPMQIDQTIIQDEGMPKIPAKSGAMH